MSYPSKRVLFQGGDSYLHQSWTDIIPENFVSMVEHGYDTAMWFGPEKNSSAALEVCEPFLSLCEEYGIMAMLGSQSEINSEDDGKHASWQLADYEAAYGEWK